MAKKNVAATKAANPTVPAQEKSNSGFFSKMPAVKTLWIILAIFGFLLYANTISNSYVLDDQMVTYGNTFVTKGFAGIGDIISKPYLAGYIKMPNDGYRPISLVAFAMEEQVFGVNPGPKHFFNVVYFSMALVFLFLFLKDLLGEKNIGFAFITTLIFAAHPIHTEVVANIKSRDEIFSFMFAFMAMYSFGRYIKTGNIGLLLGGAIVLLLSFLSKETSFAFVAIIPLTYFTLFEGAKQKKFMTIGATVVVAGIFLALRSAILSANHANDTAYLNYMDNQLVAFKSLGERLPTIFYVLGYYLRLLIAPYPLVCTYAVNTIPNATWGSPMTLLGLLLTLGFASYSVFSFFKNKKDVIGYAILFYLISMGIFTNIFVLIGSVLSERFLFLSSVGFCLANAAVLKMVVGKAAPEKDLFTISNTWKVVIPIVAVFSFMTYSRSSEWKDAYTLFSADVQKRPENARLNYYLGNEMTTNYVAAAGDAAMANQIMNDGVKYLQAAVALQPHFYDAHQALARAFFTMKQLDSAELHDKLTLRDDPKNTLALNGLAGIYFMKQNFPAAREILKQDIAINPNSADIIHNLGLCYMNLKQFDSAIIYFRQALGVNNKHKESMKNIARSYKMLAQPDSMHKYEDLARAEEPAFRVE